MKGIELRASQRILRNEFSGVGKYNIPLIRKNVIDLTSVELIAISDTRPHDMKNKHKGVHHFTDDRHFDGEYNNPGRSLEKLSQYRFLCTPQYSCYAEMPIWRQIESTAKNRWVGAFWQSKGLKVISSLCWSLATSYEFCFDGIEYGSIVAVGTIGCRNGKSAFLRGYDAMLERINPQAVICFGKPFREMRGVLISVDYIESRREVR